MKITAVRIRVLRSRSAAYGHDAAEFEAQLEDGDDPIAVAADLRRMCETEVRQGAEISRNYDTLEVLREQLVSYERSIEGTKAESRKMTEMVNQFPAFIEAARKAGVRVPAMLDEELGIPF
jgi:GTP cyclohydrolase FolE2